CADTVVPGEGGEAELSRQAIARVAGMVEVQLQYQGRTRQLHAKHAVIRPARQRHDVRGAVKSRAAEQNGQRRLQVGFGQGGAHRSPSTLSVASAHERACRQVPCSVVDAFGSYRMRTTPAGKPGSDRISGRSSMKWLHPSAAIRLIFSATTNSKYTWSRSST